MITLQKLKYFEKVSQFGSVSKAAEALSVSQSSVSQAIKDLEDYFQTPLIVREHNGVAITKTGYKVSMEIRQIHRHLDVLANLQKKKRNLTKGQLTLCVSDSGLHTTAESLRQFRAVYPNIALDIINVEWPESQNIILEKKVDLAICTVSSETSHLLQSTPIFVSPRRLWMHSEHPLADKDFITEGDLKNHSLFVYKVDLELEEIKNYI